MVGMSCAFKILPFHNFATGVERGAQPEFTGASVPRSYPDEKAAQAAAVEQFLLDEEQRRRLVVREQ